MRRACARWMVGGSPSSAHHDPNFADELAALGHEVVQGEEIPDDWAAPHDFMRSFEGSAQAIAIAGEALCGASDPRLDGIAAPL